MTQSIEEAAREIAAKALRDRQMPSPSYEAIDVEAGRYDQHSAVQAAFAGIKLGREQAAGVIAAKVEMYNAKAAKRDPFADDAFNPHDMSNELAIGMECALAEIRALP